MTFSARIALAGITVLSLMCAGTSAQTNAVPFLSQSLSPPSIAPGSKSFTLTVNGSGFASSAIVNWNGATRLTEVISSHQLKATINASDVSTAKTASITVTNPAPGGGTSSVIFFPVRSELSSLGMAISQPFGGATAVAVGDFNNDGKLDVAWGSNSGLNISLGNGNGTFQPAILKAGRCPCQIVTGDFNGDGNLDIALGNDSGVTVFLGNGDGTFTESFYNDTYTGGNDGIAVADFNRDGHLDLYVSGWDAGSDYFTILFGNGDGTFGGGSDGGYVTGVFEGFSPYGLLSGIPVVGDFNGDGYLDLAIGGYPNGSEAGIQIWLGGPAGYFTQGSTLAESAINLATADVNNDGKLDLITDTDCVLLGNGDGTFQSCNTMPASGEIDGIGDFTGNHILDVANSIDFPQPGVGINLGVGNGTFPSDLTFSGPTYSSPGAIGDFNNDGKLDVVSSSGYLLIQTTVDLTPISLTFANQNVGTISPPQTATLSNVGTSTLTINSVSITGAGAANFTRTNNCGSSLAAGASCTILVTFTPESGGFFTPSLTVSYNGTASPQKIALSGTGLMLPTVTLLPTNLKFATQVVGTTSAAQTATLTNTGDQSVTISTVSTSGAFSQTNNCPSSLGVGGSCQIRVVFTPTQQGSASGTLSVTDNATKSPQKVTLSGTGTLMSFSPLEVNFGNQKVGTASSPAPVTLTNVSGNAVSITSITITGTDPGDFSQTNNCGKSIAGHGSCTINVTFKPTVDGARSADVTVTDGGGGSPQSVSLTGTGT